MSLEHHVSSTTSDKIGKQGEQIEETLRLLSVACLLLHRLMIKAGAEALLSVQPKNKTSIAVSDQVEDVFRFTPSPEATGTG